MNGPVRAPCDEAYIATRPAGTPCRRSVEGWVLAATILGSAMAFIDGTVVNVALPALQADLHTGVAGTQWVVEAYTLFLAALILPGGSLGDRYGRRRVYALGITIFALASAWAGLAPNIGQLIAARSLQGIGGGLLVPGSLAIIGASFSPARRGRAIGTWSGFASITTAGGPVLGGWLVQNVSWRAVFFINLPLAVAVIFMLFWRVPESRNEAAPPTVDWAGAILAVAGLGALVYGLIEAGNRGMGDPVVLASVVGGLIVLAIFVFVEARSTAPMLPLGLFRSRTFSGANLLTLLLYGPLSAVFFFLPFNLIQVQGYSATAAGAALLPFSVLLFVLSRWSGGLVDRYGARLPLIAGPALAAAGIALFALPSIGGSYWQTFFPAIVVLGLGMAVTVAPLTTAVMGAAGAQNSGVASGVNNAVSRVAGLLAIALLGILVVQVFSAALGSQMAAMGAPPAVVQAMAAQRTRLTDAEIPGGLAPAMQAGLRQALDDAFVAAFRAVMLVSALLAALSALIAAVLIEGKRAPAAETAAPAVRAAAAPDPVSAASRNGASSGAHAQGEPPDDTSGAGGSEP